MATDIRKNERMVLIKTLEKEELQTIYGGSISFTTGCFIVAGVVFLLSAIDGYVRPVSCER